MKNLDPKNNPVTTILGTLFIITCLLIYTLPLFIEVKKDFTENWYLPLMPLGIGILLLFSPDSLLKAITDFITKKKNEV